MTSTTEIGDKGVRIACELWPIHPSVSGGPDDKGGCDGWLNGEPVQIKFDTRTATSGNIYHEIYEKTKDHPEQLWRPSPHAVKWYVFVTVGHAWLVHVDTLARIEVGLKLIAISQTSVGFLFPERLLETHNCERLAHGG